MTHPRRLTMLLVSVSACTELVEDTGRACLLPRDLTCYCSEGEPCGPELAVWNSQIFLCEGLYLPADDIEVEVLLREQAGTWGRDEQCTVEIVGQRLVVHGSYRENSYHPDDNLEPAVVARCPVPPLDAGSWTLVYGGAEETFVVGEEEPQRMACVDADE